MQIKQVIFFSFFPNFGPFLTIFQSFAAPSMPSNLKNSQKWHRIWERMVKAILLNSREYFKFAPQVALRVVLFVPVNLAGQMSAGQASPFTGTVF